MNLLKRLSLSHPSASRYASRWRRAPRSSPPRSSATTWSCRADAGAHLGHGHSGREGCRHFQRPDPLRHRRRAGQVDGQPLPQGRWPVRDDHRRRSAGDAPIVVKDVLVGEVWLGSGQSNMEFNVSAKGHPPYGFSTRTRKSPPQTIRSCACSPARTRRPTTRSPIVVGRWQVCSPETVPDFSAVGYLFGRDLNQALKLPVGIVLSAYGASTAEAWIPRDAMAADPLLKPMLDKFDARESYFKAHPNAPATPTRPHRRRPSTPAPAAPARCAIRRTTSTSPPCCSTP